MATSSNGSRLRSARLTTTAPSLAATSVAANCSAAAGSTPRATNSSISRARQARNTSAAWARRSGESVATVTARTAQPALSPDRTRTSRHRSRKKAVTSRGAVPSTRLPRVAGSAGSRAYQRGAGRCRSRGDRVAPGALRPWPAGAGWPGPKTDRTLCVTTAPYGVERDRQGRPIGRGIVDQRHSWNGQRRAIMTPSPCSSTSPSRAWTRPPG